MPSGCKNKTCNGVAHAFVPFPFRFRLRSVHGILRSPFSCFKCRLVVWDATAAMHEHEDESRQENNENSNSHNEGLSTSCVESSCPAPLARLFWNYNLRHGAVVLVINIFVLRSSPRCQLCIILRSFQGPALGLNSKHQHRPQLWDPLGTEQAA